MVLNEAQHWSSTRPQPASIHSDLATLLTSFCCSLGLSCRSWSGLSITLPTGCAIHCWDRQRSKAWCSCQTSFTTSSRTGRCPDI